MHTQLVIMDILTQHGPANKTISNFQKQKIKKHEFLTATLGCYRPYTTEYQTFGNRVPDLWHTPAHNTPEMAIVHCLKE